MCIISDFGNTGAKYSKLSDRMLTRYKDKKWQVRPDSRLTTNNEEAAQQYLLDFGFWYGDFGIKDFYPFSNEKSDALPPIQNH